MYRPGHYGVAMLAYAPLGLVVALAGYDAVAIVGCAIAVPLSTIPDYDHHVPLLEHRGPTHTIAFALLVGAALAGGAATLVGGNTALAGAGVVGFSFLVGAVSIGSHLFADALTPAGVRPFWPVSNRRYTMNVTRASSTAANYALLAVGVGTIVLAGIVAFSLA